MRSLTAVFLATTALAACAAPPPLPGREGPLIAAQVDAAAAAQAAEAAVQEETARINAWFEEKFEEELAFSPIQQTFLGRKTAYGEVDDFSNEAADAVLAWRLAGAEDLKTTFDRDLLTPAAQESYDTWLYLADRDAATAAFRSNDYVFEQMQAIHSFFPQLLIAFHSVETEDEMEAYISRIGESGRAIRQLIDRSKANAAAGARPPKFAFEFVIDEARKIISGAPFDEGEDNDVWADAQTKIAALVEAGTIDEARADELKGGVEAALLADWKGAYEALIAWQQEDIVNATETARGVGALPDGEAYYNERLAFHTTTALTADEIHEIGLREVERLRGEMIAVKDEIGFEGDLAQFFTYLRETKDDPRLYFPDTDAGRQGYIDDATAAIERIKAELPNFFGLLPKADLEVRRVEPFREQDGAAQHYFPGTPDGSRPGIYYAHLSDMTALPKRELEVIAYHEGLPGHHMQISIAQELEGVPTFRTQSFFTAYAEGWALYSEWLATEIDGAYEDPLSEFGRLGSEIWRGIRLVVDTGLHAKGWTEEQAVEYFLANSAAPEAQARSEVRRYMVLPGQATSYKIGMLKIQELRAKAEAELGDAFDIRGFHDAVLGGGALPLEILERRVEAWVDSVKDA